MDAPRDEQARAQPGAAAGDGKDAAAAAAADGARRAANADPAGVTLPTRASEPGLDTVSGDGASVAGARGNEAVLLPPRTAVGRYIVLEHLASGGMGVVYKAYDPDLNRQIALKLVRVAASEGADVTAARGRLLREAQGLAQLSHPNVVAIYDVGLFEDGVFLAMELVEGLTLRAWLKTAPSYRDKLRVFIAVGEGLAAAHRAGLVHRDVKPDNVILGEDGRPRVLDFGLVRAVGGPAAASQEGASPQAASPRAREGDDPPPDAPQGSEPPRVAMPSRVALATGASLASHASLSSASETSSELSEGSGELGAPLTRVGAVMGTPRYMSPEQHLGRAVDAKSDQFSFCVALYEALYGRPPFRGKTLPTLREHVCAGKLRSPPPGGRVPAPVRRALLAGLAPHPAKRHASMAELLAELRRDPSATRRRIGLALAAVVVVGGALAFAQRGAGAERCPVDRDTLRALWNPTAARAIGAAFAATERPYAADTAGRVGEALAARAAAWAAMQKESCEATWVKGSQSETLLDLRTACLAERRAEQLALVEVLSQPGLGARVVDRAVPAVDGLRPIADCADANALRSSLAPPPPGAAAEVATLRERLAQVRPLRLAGSYGDAVDALEPLVAAALELDYPPLVGEVSLEYAGALNGAGRLADTREALERSMEAAGAAGDVRTAAMAAANWLSVVGYALDRADEALLAIPLARSLAAQVPDDALVQVTLQNSIGVCHHAIGDSEGARAAYRRALERVTQIGGVSGDWAAKLHNNIGLTAQNLGDHEAAITELTQARDLRRAALGAEHPAVGNALSNLGYSQAGLGRHEQALATYDEALRLWERALGPDHIKLSEVLASKAQSLAALGRLDAAAAAAERSLELRERNLSPTHTRVGYGALVLAEVRLEQGRPIEAVALYRRAVAAYEPARPDLVSALLGLGRGLMAAGEEPAALAALERAVAFATERELRALPDAEAALAKALWSAARPRARALADKALAAYEDAGRQKERDELAGWLAAHD